MKFTRLSTLSLLYGQNVEWNYVEWKFHKGGINQQYVNVSRLFHAVIWSSKWTDSWQGWNKKRVMLLRQTGQWSLCGCAERRRGPLVFYVCKQPTVFSSYPDKRVNELESGSAPGLYGALESSLAVASLNPQGDHCRRQMYGCYLVTVRGASEVLKGRRPEGADEGSRRRPERPTLANTQQNCSGKSGGAGEGRASGWFSVHFFWAVTVVADAYGGFALY